MAKKAKKAKAARKAKGARKQTRKQQEAVLRKGPIRTRPKAQPLPGMEDMRDREVDRLLSGIADERHTQNESKASEAGYIQALHARLKTLKQTAARGHGVEVVRVPGDEKLRVRLVKGTEEQGADLAEPGDVDPMDRDDDSGDAPGYEHDESLADA